MNKVINSPTHRNASKPAGATGITAQLMDWFLLCPLFKGEDDFLIDNLGADATEYAIFSVPTDIKYSNYLSGRVMQPMQSLNFVLASRKPYGIEVLQNLENLGFFSDLQKWVYAQSQLQNFPVISEGIVKDISIKNTSFINSVAGNDAQYQVQGTLTYRI